jgi:hypothetical protein
MAKPIRITLSGCHPDENGFFVPIRSQGERCPIGFSILFGMDFVGHNEKLMLELNKRKGSRKVELVYKVNS